jgi:putative ABC transport system permease protein
MLKNYIKIAWRNILKHKLFSALNIFGLATSMSVCLLLIMILSDQYSYDNFHEKGDQIYRIISSRHQKGEEVKVAEVATTSMAIVEPLKKEYPFIEKASRVVSIDKGFHLGDKTLYGDKPGYFVDADFLEMFDFGWLLGDKHTALIQPNSIVLTESAVEKFYPGVAVLGETVGYGELGTFTITGVIPNPPVRSHISFDYLVSYASVDAMNAKEREKISIYGEGHISKGLVYVLLENGIAQSKFDDALAAQAVKYNDRSEVHNFLFLSQALSDIMPSQDLGNEIGTGTPAILLYFLMSLGFLLMLAASFNYMNLSLARSLKRSKEIGIRKVIGARKKDIVFQFLGEAILIALLSLLVALVLLELLIPVFYGLDPFIGQTVHLTRSPLMYLGFFGFSLVIGLLAGLFPAFNISSFQSIQSLKQLSNVKIFSKVGIRKVLITMQFALSLLFILIVIIVLQQHKHVIETDLGVRADNLMNIWMTESVDFDVFSQQVEQINGVEAVSSSSVDMLIGGRAEVTAHFKNNTDSIQLGFNAVAQNFIDFMEIEIIEGNNFPEDINTAAEQFIILNETAVKRMGYETPKQAIGEIVMLGSGGDSGLKIIGVTKDFHHDNIWFTSIQPYALRQGGEFQKKLDVRLSAANSVATIAAVHELWNKLSPKESISAYFTERRMRNLDKFFQMGSRIIGFIGFLTILISCMGLLGMVIFTVEGKLKEVGIRKILGASEISINWQLSKGFLMLLGIAIIIAIPITIFLANLWLQNFVLRTPISFWMISIGVGLMLFLALITVVSQTSIAARRNPVNVLKTE